MQFHIVCLIVEHGRPSGRSIFHSPRLPSPPFTLVIRGQQRPNVPTITAFPAACVCCQSSQPACVSNSLCGSAAATEPRTPYLLALAPGVCACVRACVCVCLCLSVSAGWVCSIAHGCRGGRSDVLRAKERSDPSTMPATMDIDGWIEVVKDCQYLPENELKVGECLWGPLHGSINSPNPHNP